MMIEKDSYRLDEVAVLLSVTVDSVRRWVREGRVAVTPRRRIPPDVVRRLVASNASHIARTPTPPADR